MSSPLCRYLLCTAPYAIPYQLKVTEIVAADLRVVVRELDTTVCPAHGRVLDDAVKAGWQINHTCEQWLYLEQMVVAPLFMPWG